MNDKFLNQFCATHHLPEDFAKQARLYWLTIADHYFQQFNQQTNPPFYLAIQGCQGSGKSTIAALFCAYLRARYQCRSVCLSLDDFYLSKQARGQLAQQVHPLFKTRGVPGTHDCQLLKQVLQQLRSSSGTVSIPRFNKAADDVYPQSQWQHISLPVDIVILEGWCWGIPAQADTQVKQAINELEQQEDENAKWRLHVNACLRHDYMPLYQQFDSWLSINPANFDPVLNWRLEQENRLALLQPFAKQFTLMTSNEIARFIQYFQRLTCHGLQTIAKTATVSVTLNKQRQVIAIDQTKDKP